MSIAMQVPDNSSRAPVAPGAEVLVTDVLIVGLGPVGAAMANLLGRYGVKVIAVDQADEIFAKPRAIALDHEALRILQLVGVKEGDFATAGIPQVQYHSPLFGRFARLNTATVVDGHPALVTFYQPELESVLRARLKEWPHVQVLLGTRLDGFVHDGVGVTADLIGADNLPIRVKARYVVGADGANSLVRRTLGLDFTGSSFTQDWLIVDARNVPQPVDHCEFICDPRRPTPHMVAPGGRQRWEFMLRPGETREQMETPESVNRLLKPWCDGAQIEIERLAVYRFHAREAASFSRGRCFLVGDAAHITPPFAGQGLVAGLRDVANLAWKVAYVVKGKAKPEVLESYDQERRPHARKIINLARFLGALVMPSNRLVAFLLHGAIRLAHLVPATRALFEDLKIKPQNTFERGLFWRSGSDRLRAGSTFPQAWVRTPGGAPELSDDVLGMGWALVGFGVDPTGYVPRELMQRFKGMGGQMWQWCHRAQAQHLGEPATRIEALDDSHLKKVPLDWVVVVRPDRCVFAEGPIVQVSALLQRVLELVQAADAPSFSPELAQPTIAQSRVMP